MNIWVKLGLATAAMFGGSQLMAAVQTKTIGEKLTSTIKNTRIHKVNLSFLEIRFEILINNPSASSLDLIHPALNIYSENVLITSSPTNGKKYNIKAEAITKLDTISFKIGWQKISDLLLKKNTQGDLNISNILTNPKLVVNSLKLSANYITEVNGLPYSQTQFLNF